MPAVPGTRYPLPSTQYPATGVSVFEHHRATCYLLMKSLSPPTPHMHFTRAIVPFTELNPTDLILWYSPHDMIIIESSLKYRLSICVCWRGNDGGRLYCRLPSLVTEEHRRHYVESVIVTVLLTSYSLWVFCN